MSNIHTVYTYYCNDEKKMIDEERVDGSLPTKCVNNINHKIKLDSIYIKDRYQTYCKVKPMTGTTNESDTTINADDSNDPLLLQKIARRLLVLEKCAIAKGFIVEDKSLSNNNVNLLNIKDLNFLN